MARFTPTHEPPDFPDTEVPPEESAPGGRQMLRMFIPVAVAIVVFIGALLLVIKFLVIPALERGDSAAQARGVATLGALQTQQAVTRSQQGLTPQTTQQPANTPRPATTAQPASQPTLASGAAAVPPASQVNQAPTNVTAPGAVETRPNSVSTVVGLPATDAAPPTPGAASATHAPAVAATPMQAIDTSNVQAQTPAASAPPAVSTVDPVAQAEVLQAYSHYWEQRTLAFRDLDPSLLSSVAADPELAGLTERIEQLRSEGRAIRTHVIHHFVALPTAPGEAVVADEYEDLSTYIDSSTKEPIDPTTANPQSGPIVKVREVLQRIDGVWKVTGGQLYE